MVILSWQKWHKTINVLFCVGFLHVKQLKNDKFIRIFIVFTVQALSCEKQECQKLHYLILLQKIGLLNVPKWLVKGADVREGDLTGGHFWTCTF